MDSRNMGCGEIIFAVVILMIIILGSMWLEAVVKASAWRWVWS